jgi:hypothetical protein
MKTKRILGLLTIGCSLAVTLSSHGSSPFSERDARNNAAIAASPRAREAFPWLTRVATPPQTAVCCAERNSELAAARRNRGFAASPRVRELFPELARGTAHESEFTIAVVADVPEAVMKNRAWANSPRVREEFPALSRGAMEKVPPKAEHHR